jgi:hypothetical protein
VACGSSSLSRDPQEPAFQQHQVRAFRGRPILAWQLPVGDLVEAWQPRGPTLAQRVDHAAGECDVVRTGRPARGEQRMDVAPERQPLGMVEVDVVDRQHHRPQPTRARQRGELRGQRRLAGALQARDAVNAAVVRERIVQHADDEVVGKAAGRRRVRAYGHRATIPHAPTAPP